MVAGAHSNIRGILVTVVTVHVRRATAEVATGRAVPQTSTIKAPEALTRTFGTSAFVGVVALRNTF